MVPLVYHDSYSQLVLPARHQFPITKYQHLQQYLLSHGIAAPEQFVAPTPATVESLCRIHCPQYVHDFIHGHLSTGAIRRLGFPWSENLVHRTLHSMGGSALCANLAIKHGIALHLAGGYHHAHFDFGSGYCVFNDLVFAARHLLDENLAERVLIVDCDVHQGDGTATLCQNEPQIMSLSLHCDSNFPSRKPPSDYDVPLHKGISDSEYLNALEETLGYLIRLEKPDAIIYDAGVDIHQDDRLGYLNVSTQGLFERDRLVLELAKQSSIPIAAVIGGGYSTNPLHLSERHSQLFIAAKLLWQKHDSFSGAAYAT